MIDVLAIVLRFFLAAVFAVAAVAKFRDREGTAEALKGFGVPDRFVPQAIYLLPVVEALCVVLLVIPATYLLGTGVAVALLIAFTVAIIVNLARGNRVPCGCFGEMSPKPIGGRTVGRNISLLAFSAYVLLAAPSTFGNARVWFDSLSPGDAKLSLAAGVVLSVLSGMTWLLVHLFDQNHVLANRLKAMENDGQPTGLEIGSEAPGFELPTTDGTTLELSHLLARRKPVVLTFTDPHCGPCQTLVPQLAVWQKSLKNVFTVGVVSRGNLEDNAAHATTHGLAEVMLQNGNEVAQAYGAPGTPTAVRVSADGTIASYVAGGVEEITSMFQTLVSEHAQAMWIQATGEEVPRPQVGLPLGTDAPSTDITDLDGNHIALLELLHTPTMLIFWSPHCSFCNGMVDSMRTIEARLPEGRSMLFATKGTVEENRFLAFRSRMVFDPNFELAAYFQATGTPAGVLVDKGKIVSYVGSGVGGVLALAEEFLELGVQPVGSPTFRPRDN
jgi:peroxiredoxin/uncharacterized membrane protein YphA (DoxX/SURF4 family)